MLLPSRNTLRLQMLPLMDHGQHFDEVIGLALPAMESDAKVGSPQSPRGRTAYPSCA